MSGENVTVITPGMRVVGSDGTPIGVVQQILAAGDGSDARLLLSDSGPVIPAQVIATVSGDVVRISMSAATAQSTQWGTPPQDFRPVGSFEWRADSSTIRVQRLEEHLEVDKSWVQSGTVEVRKSVVEEPQTLDVDLAREVYDVERVAVNRPWQPGDDSPRTEGATIIVPVVTEQLEILRRKVVTEEIRLTKRVVTEHQQVTDTVRREVVDVSGPVTANPGTTGGEDTAGS
ncbi:MAG: DUF2382 domain-containing protein [Chloroflexota bacterium]|nr:DUF2382 domain-containing protein [Chloroflexota bacterium]